MKTQFCWAGFSQVCNLHNSAGSGFATLLSGSAFMQKYCLCKAPYLLTSINSTQSQKFFPILYEVNIHGKLELVSRLPINKSISMPWVPNSPSFMTVLNCRFAPGGPRQYCHDENRLRGDEHTAPPHQTGTTIFLGLKGIQKLFFSGLGLAKDNGRSQCWGSMPFWCGSGSGSADPYLWLMDPNPTSDQTPFFGDFKGTVAWDGF